MSGSGRAGKLKPLSAERSAADAERVYRDGLADRPNNGWSLTGLEQALRAQGKTAEADRAREERDRAWARSDAWIPRSRY